MAALERLASAGVRKRQSGRSSLLYGSTSSTPCSPRPTR